MLQGLKVTSPLISLIIPCYNAEQFIQETINSVLQQSYQRFEIIVINDGSIDGTESIIKGIVDERVKYIYKTNTGVSDSRNQGLKIAEGIYVVFLDADDLLADNFLEVRVRYLENNDDKDFCCSKVKKINYKGEFLEGEYTGAAINVEDEVLLYRKDIVTCPSNYMIKLNTLIANHIIFNKKLSSSADRYFLLQLNKVAKGGLVEGGELLYRINNNSMSHKLSIDLLMDNELFYKEVIRTNLFSKRTKNKFIHKINYILGASYFKLKFYNKSLPYLCKAYIFKFKEIIS